MVLYEYEADGAFTDQTYSAVLHAPLRHSVIACFPINFLPSSLFNY